VLGAKARAAAVSVWCSAGVRLRCPHVSYHASCVGIHNNSLRAARILDIYRVLYVSLKKQILKISHWFSEKSFKIRILSLCCCRTVYWHQANRVTVGIISIPCACIVSWDMLCLSVTDVLAILRLMTSVCVSVCLSFSAKLKSLLIRDCDNFVAVCVNGEP